jgi:hypothetical protein
VAGWLGGQRRLKMATAARVLLDVRFSFTLIDAGLLAGSAIFGLGWGIVGFCPTHGDRRAFGACPRRVPEIDGLVRNVIANLNAMIAEIETRI